MAERGQTPAPTYFRPALGEGLDFYLCAFHELGTCRPGGMSLGQIPWTAILAFAQFYGLGDDATDYLRKMIRALDAAFIGHISQAEPAKEKPDGS